MYICRDEIKSKEHVWYNVQIRSMYICRDEIKSKEHVWYNVPIRPMYICRDEIKSKEHACHFSWWSKYEFFKSAQKSLKD